MEKDLNFLFIFVVQLYISINLERNAFKGEKSRIVSCDICQVWAILVSKFPSFPRYKEGTGGRGQIEPGPSVAQIAIDREEDYV